MPFLYPYILYIDISYFINILFSFTLIYVFPNGIISGNPPTKGRERRFWCFLSCYSKHTVAQMIELTETWDAHVTSLQWTYFLRNISFSAPEGLSDRIWLSMGEQSS